MTYSTKFIVVPYSVVKGDLEPRYCREAPSASCALELAEGLAVRFPAVVAAEMIVDDETGDMDDPHILAVFGLVPDEVADAA